MNEDQTLTIEIKLGNLVVGEETFGEFIATKAAELLLEEVGDAEELLRRRARAISDEEIRAALKPTIEEAIAKAVQPTDSWGQPKGTPKTLREVIVETGARELQARRDSLRTAGRGDQSLLAQVIREEVEHALGKELREAIGAAKGEVVAAVREKGAEVIADTIVRISEGRPVS